MRSKHGTKTKTFTVVELKLNHGETKRVTLTEWHLAGLRAIIGFADIGIREIKAIDSFKHLA
jgi:hypothetical protein